MAFQSILRAAEPAAKKLDKKMYIKLLNKMGGIVQRGARRTRHVWPMTRCTFPSERLPGGHLASLPFAINDEASAGLWMQNRRWGFSCSHRGLGVCGWHRLKQTPRRRREAESKFRTEFSQKQPHFYTILSCVSEWKQRRFPVVMMITKPNHGGFSKTLRKWSFELS